MPKAVMAKSIKVFSPTDVLCLWVSTGPGSQGIKLQSKFKYGDNEAELLISTE